MSFGVAVLDDLWDVEWLTTYDGIFLGHGGMVDEYCFA
jgi:hypothetical protein